MTERANVLKVRFTYLSGAGELYGDKGPYYATDFSAGIDLRACFPGERLNIGPGDRAGIPTGIAIEGVPGVAGFVFSRSGLGARDGLTVAQGVGVIDPDYRGEIVVYLLNTSGATQQVERGQRIAQLIFLPYFHAELEQAGDLSATTRGAGGFGHTGGN